MQEVSSTLPKTFPLLRNIFDAWAPSGDSQQVRTPFDAPGLFLSWETWENTFTPSPTVEVGPKMHHSALRRLINTVPCFTWVFPFIQTHVCLQVPSLIPVLLFKLGKEKNPGVAHAVLNCLPNLGTHKVLSTSVLHFSSLLWRSYRTVNTNHCMSPLFCRPPLFQIIIFGDCSY